MREGLIQKQVKKFLSKLSGCWFYKTQDTSFVGLPDFIGCYKGVFFAIELKRPGKKATAIQAIILNIILTCGGEACVAHSVMDVRKFMEGIYARRMARQ